MKKVSVAIIGSGPAGLSAALWAKKLGLFPFVIEKASVTGGMQNFNFLENSWVLGQQGVTGVDIAKNFYQHIQKEDIPVHVNLTMTAIKRVFGGFYLEFSDGSSKICESIILANGTRYVGQEILESIPGFEDINRERIIEGPYSFIGMDDLRGQHIVILGAGDNGFENALMLLECGCEVSLIARSTPKAQQKFVEKVLAHQHFSLYEYAKITHFFINNHRMSIKIKSSTEVTVSVDRIHILVGYRANTDSVIDIVEQGLGKKLDCHHNDFLWVDQVSKTNVPGIYAAGDICNTHFPCVVSAIASGALAAKTISRELLKTGVN
ncbi:hypothetical protein AB835_04325 [Candidatus Endobugula sertula]|uniref:FAD/NAD(P)-binding domain-containing protein n=1 Tax=Candidatus Endobugula sertula TaxID=62101 RepID=A0A1D2QRP8_9GAMM|nr:hypothetical protein AB835_04325 [Candidatus Endobugula sertula]